MADPVDRGTVEKRAALIIFDRRFNRDLSSEDIVQALIDAQCLRDPAVEAELARLRNGLVNQALAIEYIAERVVTNEDLRKFYRGAAKDLRSLAESGTPKEGAEKDLLADALGCLWTHQPQYRDRIVQYAKANDIGVGGFDV